MKRFFGGLGFLILILVMLATAGCQFFGLSDVGEQIEALQTPTGNAKVSFRIVMPGSNTASSPDAIILSGSRARAYVTFRLTLVHPGSTKLPTVITQTVEAVDGVAQASFESVPAQPVVGEIQIASGSIGGKTDFHGAADLNDGGNVVDISPKGSNMRADVLAQVVLSIANDQSLMEKAPRQLTTAVDTAGSALLASPTSSVYTDVLNATIITAFDPTAFVKLEKSLDELTLSGSGSATWQIKANQVWTSGLLARIWRILRQGFGTFSYVSWYGGGQGGVTKLNTFDGSVLTRLTSVERLDQFVVMPNNDLIVGGTLGGKPMLCRWDASADFAITADMQTGIKAGAVKWIQRFDGLGTNVNVPNPSVEFVQFDLVNGGRLTCAARSPSSRGQVLCELNPETGAVTYTTVTQTMAVWARPADGANVIGWDSMAGATSYNLYWSTASPVSKLNSTMIASASNPFTHAGLTNGTTYYYVVTWNEGPASESAFSIQVEATPKGTLPPPPALAGALWGWGYNNAGSLGNGTTTPAVSPVPLFRWGDVVAISGYYHTAALMRDGTVKVAGANDWGELGIGDSNTGLRALTPVVVQGLSGVRDVQCGANHVVALMNDGTLKAWGRNDRGQLGNGQIIPDRVPAPVTVLNASHVQAIAVGGHFSYALLEDGRVMGWGSNATCQFATGTPNTSTNDFWSTPAIIPGLSGVKAIAAAAYEGWEGHAMALLTDETVVCWGWNGSAQLGDGNSYSTRSEIERIVGLDNITAIACGNVHSVALRRDGTVFVWGDTKTNFNNYVPAPVPGLGNVSKIAAHKNVCFFIEVDGTLKAYGSNDSDGGGRLGDGTTIPRREPVPVTTFGRALAVFPHWQGAFVLAEKIPPMLRAAVGDGQVTLDWKAVPDAGGYNLYWSNVPGVTKANGNKIPGVRRPFIHSGLTNGKAYHYVLTSLNAAGESAESAEVVANPRSLVTPGSRIQRLVGWGGSLCLFNDNSVSPAPGASRYPVLRPISLAKLGDVRRISSADFVAMLMGDGTVQTWGGNYYGRLGDGTFSDRMINKPVPGLTGVKDVQCGQDHAVALMADGTVKAWGSNYYGQLGNGVQGNNASSPVPIAVPGLSNVRAIAVSSYHTLALLENGTVMAWGSNNHGQLGDGTIVTPTNPVQVSGLSNVKAIAANGDMDCNQGHNLALLNSGSVMAWGTNSRRELGIGTTVDQMVPVQVASLPGIIDIACGYWHCLALAGDGTVFSWGWNGTGQLGDGSVVDQAYPQAVQALPFVKKVACGGKQSYAILRDGTLMAWGENLNGELGDGSRQYRYRPTRVPSLGNVTEIFARCYTVYAFSEGTVPPEAPHRLKAVGASGTITLLWDPVPGATTYNLYHATAPIGLLASATVVKNASQGYVFPSLASSTVFFFRVTALSAGGESQPSNEAFAKPRDALSPTVKANVTLLGVNENGNLGFGNDKLVATSVPAPQWDDPVAAAGKLHTLVLMRNGEVYASGNNDQGQLGVNRLWYDTGEAPNIIPGLPFSYSPMKVANLTGVRDVQCGCHHSVALMSDGTVRTWGRNDRGQLGDGTTGFAIAPAPVPGLTNVVSIAVGGHHNLALLQNGTVMAWGWNSNGQLGLDPKLTAFATVPAPVPGLSGVTVTAIGAGGSYYNGGHSAALLADGRIMTWGQNGSDDKQNCGVLGDGTTTERFTPGPVLGLPDHAIAISIGPANCLALLRDGSVWHWGQIILGIHSYNLLPKRVPGLGPVRKIGTGWSFNVILQQDGTVKAWGSMKLMRGDPAPYGEDTQEPVPITGLGQVSDLSVLDRGLFAFANGGYVGATAQGGGIPGGVDARSAGDGSICVFWNPVDGVGSYNLYYSEDPAVAKGTGTKVTGAVPGQLIQGLTNGKAYYFTVTAQTGGIESPESEVVSAVSTGQTGGKLTYGWGYSDNGELGYQGNLDGGDNASQDKPVLLPGWGDVVSMNGELHVVALRRDGKVVTCGRNNEGQLGDGSLLGRRVIPYVIPGLSDIKDAKAGYLHSVALASGGAVYTWGSNGAGQLGLGLRSDELGRANVPTLVPALSSGVAAIAVCGNSNLALLNNGEIRAWGYNAFGQLGNGTTTTALSPVRVTGINNAVAIFAGAAGDVPAGCFAKLSDGSWMAWGYNSMGRLGIGTNNPDVVLAPTPAPGLNGFSSIQCGGEYSCALMQDGTVKAWGYNQYGQLGDGTVLERWSPKTIPGLRGVKKLVAGNRFGLALLQDGTVKMWGWMFGAYSHSGIQDDKARYIPVDLAEVSDVVDLFALSYGAVVVTTRPVAQPFKRVKTTR